MARTKTKWVRVSARKPCPVCGSPDWCAFGEDGSVAICMRVASAKEVESCGGIGFLHKLDSTALTPAHERPPKEQPKLSSQELTDLARRMFDDKRADARRRQVSAVLGVSVVSLELLKVGYGADRAGEYSSWPARDWRGAIVGIVRRYDDGSKKSYPGGSTGLFYELEWHKRPGPVLIVEGGSDTAAAITAGLAAIGRPSNTGLGRDCGVRRMLQSTARARGTPRRAIVVGEADSKPEKRGTNPQMPHCTVDCGGCLHCFPGMAGAQMCAGQLGCPWVMPPEGCKDFRDAMNKGRLWPGLMQAL